LHPGQRPALCAAVTALPPAASGRPPMLVLSPEQAAPLVQELAPSLAMAPPPLADSEQGPPSTSLSEARFQARHGHLPAWAEVLHAHSERSVLLTGLRWAQHTFSWLFTGHAQGWLTQVAPSPGRALPLSQEVQRLRADIEQLRALGHVDADAAVLALGRQRSPAGQVITLPCLGLNGDLPWQWQAAPRALFAPFQAPADGLYGIVATGEQMDTA